MREGTQKMTNFSTIKKSIVTAVLELFEGENVQDLISTFYYLRNHFYKNLK